MSQEDLASLKLDFEARKAKNLAAAKEKKERQESAVVPPQTFKGPARRN